MKISTQHQLLIIETTVSVLVGIVHSVAGILISYAFVFGHIYYERPVPPSQPTSIIRMQKQQTKSIGLSPDQENPQ